jgi:hypothetical protein
LGETEPSGAGLPPTGRLSRQPFAGIYCPPAKADAIRWTAA